MKNTTQLPILASLLVFTMLGTEISVAQPAIDPDFAALDTNGDGLISWPEYAAKHPVSGRLNPRLIFDNVDRNRDGYIDPDEFTAMKKRRRR